MRSVIIDLGRDDGDVVGRESVHAKVESWSIIVVAAAIKPSVPTAYPY
jgi:hypothetical protein